MHSPRKHSFESTRQVEAEAAPSIPEIASDLSVTLRLAFAKAVEQITNEYPDVAKHLQDLPSTATELSVETYTDARDVSKQLDNLKEVTLEKPLPQNAALLVLRFPEAFAYKHSAENPYNEIALAKTDLTRTLWGIRDTFTAKHAVDIERVNPIADHDDTPLAGYYYIWLVTPKGKMPKEFVPVEIEEES